MNVTAESTADGTQWTNVTGISVNVTSRYSIVGDHEDALKIALQVMLKSLLAFVLVATGAEITWKEVWTHLRRPVGVAIGMTSQFIILPLSAFALAHAFRLSPYEAMSFIIVACCPSGIVSNLFTMICKGNVSLSICMSAMSTCFALGLMPLNIFLYSRNFVTGNIHVPYANIAITLVLIFILVLIGIAIKSRFPKVAPWVSRIGTIAGLTAVANALIIQSLLIPDLFDCGWHVYLVSMLLPLMGFVFGFLWAYIFRMSHKDCRTIAFETGSQNFPLSLTIILTSFPFDKHREMTAYPMLFLMFNHIEAFLYISVFHWWYIRHKHKKAVEVNIIRNKVPHNTEEVTKLHSTLEFALPE